MVSKYNDYCDIVHGFGACTTKICLPSIRMSVTVERTIHGANINPLKTAYC